MNLRPSGYEPVGQSTSSTKPRIDRKSAARSRRSATAPALYRPCLRALALPIGAPGEAPPCIRQRPFAIAGDWHGVSARVRAWQRGLRCMGNLLCMGLILKTVAIPTPRLTGCGDHADHGLPAGVDVDVFHRDLLLALAAVTIERFE